MSSLKLRWPFQPHQNHRAVRNVRVGSFAGKRLQTHIVRCKDCAGAILDIDQAEMRRGLRV